MFKTLAVSISLTFILSAAVIAQPRMSSQDRVQRLKEKLSLTDEQVVKVEAILKEAENKMANIRKGEKPDWNAMKSEMEETNNKINDVINDDQKVLYKQMIDERKDRMSDNKRRHDK